MDVLYNSYICVNVPCPLPILQVSGVYKSQHTQPEIFKFWTFFSEKQSPVIQYWSRFRFDQLGRVNQCALCIICIIYWICIMYNVVYWSRFRFRKGEPVYLVHILEAWIWKNHIVEWQSKLLTRNILWTKSIQLKCKLLRRNDNCIKYEPEYYLLSSSSWRQLTSTPSWVIHLRSVSHITMAKP